MTKLLFCGILSIDLGTERWLSWSKARDWKSRNGGEPFWGSNPHLSANKKVHPIGCTFLLADLNNGDENGVGVNDCRWQSELPLTEGAELSQGRKRQRATESESLSLRQRITVILIQRNDGYFIPKISF